MRGCRIIEHWYIFDDSRLGSDTGVASHRSGGKRPSRRTSPPPRRTIPGGTDGENSKRLMRQYNGRWSREIAYRVYLTDINLLGLDFVRDERRLHYLWSRLLTHMRRDENVGDEDVVRIHSTTLAWPRAILRSFYSVLRTWPRKPLTDAWAKSPRLKRVCIWTRTFWFNFPEAADDWRMITSRNLDARARYRETRPITAWRWHSAFAASGEIECRCHKQIRLSRLQI